MIKLALVFKTAPHGSAASREGLDALLAASAFCEPEEIAVFFMGDGVLNLLADQQPEQILQDDFIRRFKLLDLYEIEQRFICQQSYLQYGLTNTPLIINCEQLEAKSIIEKLQMADKILTF